MSVNIFELTLYSGALLILFLTPGPVWFALLARTLSGGFQAAWPLAFGVAVGDILWPLLAVLGMSWIVSEVDGILNVLRWVACAMFVFMGITAIRHAGRQIGADSRLTRPGKLAGFLAGMAAILGNPKAILFYMGVLPGFFDLRAVTRPDIVAIVCLSVAVPFFGNLGFAVFVDRIRRLLNTPSALRRMNLIAGWLLIAIGLILPWT
ncbi:MAG: LysE family translocator [Marinibacterium sp.]